MKYFIPAWYSGHQWWESKMEPYFYNQAETTFDDMISLMSMHRLNHESFQMIVLNYTPDLRTFLHRHDLFDMTYWSVFDEIQGFQHRTPRAIDYRHLDWPVGTEFLYLAHMIRAMMPDEMHADVYFNQDGYVIWIEVFQHNVSKYRYVLDDRGYVSSIIYFDEAGKPNHQRYLTHDGDWILQEDLVSGEVSVHEQYAHYFSQQRYASMSEVIFEYVAQYRDQVFEQTDTVIVAADMRHNKPIADIFAQYKRCYSVFQQRPHASIEALESMDPHANWLVDTLDNEQLLEAYRVQRGISNRLLRITPFDAQPMSNISSQLHETFIGVWIDGMGTEQLLTMLTELTDYLNQDEALRLVLLSKSKPKYALPTELKRQIEAINAQMNEKDETSEAVSELMKGKEPIDYIQVKYVPFELDIIEAISTLRIVIDLSKEPDLFLQICCLSTGIPQINVRATDYVTHKENGYVVDGETRLHVALDYYLMQLKNWNKSYAYAMKLAKKYASDKIIAQLDALIEGENDGAEV
ncbi:accessory Sec system protein Asp1 [Staphylococcus rostri]|nr:accessory Sec system protein Asp1 [Staphylococcus rostri]